MRLRTFFCAKQKIENMMLQKIIEIKLNDLVPYTGNSRTHSDQQVNQIAASIKEFGFTNPVLVDTEGGIIAGHGRVMAAQKLGLDAVPTICLDHLSDAQRRAYVIADNKLALNAGWNEEALAAEIARLTEEDFDINLLGFDDSEIDLLLNETDEGLNDGDEIPDEPEKAINVKGDVWLLGENRLMCGDTTSSDSVNKLMNGKTWDVCVFDPPYQLTELYNYIPKYEGAGKLAVMWDFKRFALAAQSALEKGWTAQYEFIWDNVQSWYTPNRPLARHKSIGVFCENPFFNTELALIQDGKKREAKTVSNTRGTCDYKPLDGQKHIATVEAFPNTQQSDEHGHGKPIAWIKAIFAGMEGDIYFDAFGGSGATLIACQQLNKKCYTMELDPKYCDVIIKRWQDFTGLQATHEETGKSFDQSH